MSRAGYDDSGDMDQWSLIMWRGAVTSALRGKRGQDFLREMLAAMDALPEKKLIKGDLVDKDGCACALGTVALARGADVSNVDPYDHEGIGPLFGIADAMAREVMWENDDGTWKKETPEERFVRMRGWVVSQIGAWRPMVEGDL
jgi:hypothetical protein